MRRPANENALRNATAGNLPDPYLRPAFSRRDRALRALWGVTHALFYRTTPVPMHAWRSLLLRCFGAKMGPNCHFYPASKVWAPWNLVCADQVTAANGTEIYNPAPMHFGSHAIVSQGAYLCGATHDYDDPNFPLLAYEMSFGAHSWVCARAIVAPGVNLGEGAVLGLGSIATHDLAPWTVNAGVPAHQVKQRVRPAGVPPA